MKPNTKTALAGLLSAVTALALIAAPAVVAASSAVPAGRVGTGQAAANEPRDVTVQMAALRMIPDKVEITTGTTVTWVNNEAFDYPLVGGSHQIAADDGSFTSPNIAPGTRWSHRFDRPGTFAYHCTRHAGTTGEITVTGPPIAARPAEQEVAITEPNPDDPTSWGFQPADLVIAPGTTVVWRNNGKNTHTVTAYDKTFDSGDIAPGTTWKHTFDAPGAFAYHCTPHPWMKAAIRVAAPGAEAPPPPTTEPAPPTPPVRHHADTEPRPVGDKPVRHDAFIVEADPAKPFEWGFEPATLDVKIGDTVAWHNTGGRQHTVTADAFDSGLIPPGATWARTFDTPGLFNYHCTPHPWMKGVVRVTARDATALPPLRVAASPATSAAPGTSVMPPAVEIPRSGNGPVRYQASILEPDITKAMEWRFDPPTITAVVGDTIVWTNRGTLQHSVTADDGSFDAGLIDPGKTFERRFDQPGVYPYHCTPHPWMKGVIRVAEAGAGAAPSPIPAAPGEQAAATTPAGRYAAGPSISASSSDHPGRKLGLALLLSMTIVGLTVLGAMFPWRPEEYG